MTLVTREQLVELTDDSNLFFADGFDDAILGVATRCGQPTIVVYDRTKCIDILMHGNELPMPTREIAEEHFSFNSGQDSYDLVFGHHLVSIRAHAQPPFTSYTTTAPNQSSPRRARISDAMRTAWESRP